MSLKTPPARSVSPRWYGASKDEGTTSVPSRSVLSAEVNHQPARRPKEPNPLAVSHSHLLGCLRGQRDHQLEMSIIPVHDIDRWDRLVVVIPKVDGVDAHEVIHSQTFPRGRTSSGCVRQAVRGAHGTFEVLGNLYGFLGGLTLPKNPDQAVILQSDLSHPGELSHPLLGNGINLGLVEGR